MITKRLQVLVISAVLTATSFLTYNVANAVTVTKLSTKTSAIQKVKASKIVKNTINLDGKAFTLRQTVIDGKKVFCASDLSYAFGVKYQWSAKTKTATLTKDGKLITLKEDSQFVNGIFFYEIDKFMSKLGNDQSIETIDDEIYISTVKLLDASNVDPQFIDASNVLVAHETDAGIAYYEVNVNTKKSVNVILESANATEATVSPDGKKVAYINDSGEVYVVDLATKTCIKVNPDTDTLVKAELQWSQNGDKLYFITDIDNTNDVAQINIETKTLTTLLHDFDDKGDQIKKYKTDLHISEDGTQMYFCISLSGSVKQDSTVGEDTNPDDVINTGAVANTKDTESQLYYYKVGTVNAKGLPSTVKLTATNDNKIYVNRLSDGSTDFQKGNFEYVSTDLDKEGSNPILRVISADGKITKDLVNDVSVLQSIVTADGQLIILAIDNNGSKAIYQVDETTGLKQTICAVNDNVEKLFISKDGKQLGAMISTDLGSKVAVLLNSQLIDITK